MTIADPFAALADRLERRRLTTEPSLHESGWEPWLRRLFPAYCTAPFAPHHRTFWDWLWAIRVGVAPDPFIGIWNRGGAKSTSAELALVALAARSMRRYGLYVCGTQDLADKHVATIAAILESEALAREYPAVATRMVGKYGQSKGWRRNRLRTASGFTLDALGLDVAARGIKVEDQRPDVLVVDDIDEIDDSPKVTAHKIELLTKSLLPTGADDLAVMGMQNLVHPDSVFARLAGLSEHGADYLAGRIVSGPIPAVDDLEYTQQGERWVITGGTPTWAGMPISVCETYMNRDGPTSFLSERQHVVEPPAGGMFDHIEYRHCTWDDAPWKHFTRVVVWVDPAVTSTDDSDSQGIQADALHIDGPIYRLWSWEGRTSPLDAICRALRKAHELGAEAVGIETDQGGDTWLSVYREAVVVLRGGLDGHMALGKSWKPPAYRWAKAGQGHGPKVHRAGQMLAAYERFVFVHVEGTHTVLERALHRFPKTKPLDLVDASYWSWQDLVGGTRAQDVALDFGTPITGDLMRVKF